jgi:hypothetical protein
MEDVENGEIQAFRKKLGNFRSHSTKVRCVKDFKKEFWNSWSNLEKKSFSVTSFFEFAYTGF